MAGNVVARKRTTQCRTKVKTGCTTCRIRKVKCDEDKPFCRRCVDTGRVCDGYESPFRLFSNQPLNITTIASFKSSTSLEPIQAASVEINSQEISLLNRSFSTKTIFNVKLDCDDEAKQVLQASFTDLSIRHAISSLRALRKDFEMSRDTQVSALQQSPSYDYGLQQYCKALGRLASNLLCPSSSSLQSALICCQIFISIEQVRGDYATMTQHIIQGLKIMHQYRARPSFINANKWMPACHSKLPFLDIFLIKLFAAPCKFADPSASAQLNQTASLFLVPQHEQGAKSHNLRMIVPDIRMELTRIATLTLTFLDDVSCIASPETALPLLAKKLSLLDSLESWLTGMETVYTATEANSHEPVSVSFMRIFHQILKVVLIGALDSSSDVSAQLEKEYERLRYIGSIVGERVRAYGI